MGYEQIYIYVVTYFISVIWEIKISDGMDIFEFFIYNNIWF